jgi:hypothetical protein
MDIYKEWKARPPSRALQTLAHLVEDFIARFPRSRRDTVVTFCMTAANLLDAISIAVSSKNAEGKHHNHQSKIKREVYGEWKRKLMTAFSKRVDERDSVCPFQDFDELHDFIADNIIPGVGPLFVYDVATRIGAYLRIEPESVYMHAGAREGAKALGLPFRSKRILKHQLPVELRRLPPDEVEDFLCTYREAFVRMDIHV